MHKTLYRHIPRSTSNFCFRTDASNDANLASSAFSFSKSPDAEDVIIDGSKKCKIKIGNAAKTNTDHDIAIGNSVLADGSGNTSSIAIGKDCKATNTSIAIGNSAKTSLASSDIAIGDSFDIIAGCDKTASICSGRFSNIINFRGFPDIPGTDKMLTTAGTMIRDSRN